MLVKKKLGSSTTLLSLGRYHLVLAIKLIFGDLFHLLSLHVLCFLNTRLKLLSLGLDLRLLLRLLNALLLVNSRLETSESVLHVQLNVSVIYDVKGKIVWYPL